MTERRACISHNSHARQTTTKNGSRREFKRERDKNMITMWRWCMLSEAKFTIINILNIRNNSKSTRNTKWTFEMICNIADSARGRMWIVASMVERESDACMTLPLQLLLFDDDDDEDGNSMDVRLTTKKFHLKSSVIKMIDLNL